MNRPLCNAFNYLSVAMLLVLATASQAQEADAFLACADITDRVQRVICLEEALEAAKVAEQAVDDTTEQEQTSAVESFGEPESRVAETNSQDASGNTATEAAIAVPAESTEERSFFRLPRIGNIFSRDRDAEESEPEAADSEPTEAQRLEEFGRGPRVVINENGEDELNDVVVELLMAKPNMWLIRLESGQVWNQVHPKRLNLREGDVVRIYPTGWGDNFRLETARLSGYIQVLRVE